MEIDYLDDQRRCLGGCVDPCQIRLLCCRSPRKQGKLSLAYQMLAMAAAELWKIDPSSIPSWQIHQN